MDIFFTQKQTLSNATYNTASGAACNVILLHGWGGSHASMQGLQDELNDIKQNQEIATTYNVYNLDLPGFGKSPLTKPDMNLDDYILEILKFILDHNIQNPILVGHSFGGKIITKLASLEKIPIKGIVLIASSGLDPKNYKKVGLLKRVAGVGKKIFSLPILRTLAYPVRKFFYYYIVRERDYFDAGEILQKTFINVNKENLDAIYPKIKVPTLIIWGEEDSVTPLWMGETIAKLIPNAKLEVIKGVRHNLIMQYPQIVSKIIYNNFK